MPLPEAGPHASLHAEAETIQTLTLAVAGTGKVLLAQIAVYGTTEPTVDLRGVGAFTLLWSVQSAFPPPFTKAFFYVFDDPPDGTAYVDITFGSGQTFAAGVQLFTGAVQRRTAGTATNSGLVSNVSPASELGDLVVDLIHAYTTSFYGPELGPGAGQTESYEQDEPVNDRQVIASSWKVGAAGSTLMTQNASVSCKALHHLALALVGAADMSNVQEITLREDLIQTVRLRLGLGEV